MRSSVLSILLLCLFGLSLQGFTHTEILAAVNFARTKPFEFSETAKLTWRFWNAKTLTWVVSSREVDCYKNAYDWLRTKAPKLSPLAGSRVAVYAAYYHTKYLATVLNKLSHDSADGTKASARIERAGTYASGSWAMNENIAGAMPGHQSANDWVFQWIADCGYLTVKGHRDNIYSTSITHYGCSEVPSATGWVYVTCDGVTEMKFRPEIESNSALLSEAGL